MRNIALIILLILGGCGREMRVSNHRDEEVAVYQVLLREVFNIRADGMYYATSMRWGDWTGVEECDPIQSYLTTEIPTIPATVIADFCVANRASYLIDPTVLTELG